MLKFAPPRLLRKTLQALAILAAFAAFSGFSSPSDPLLRAPAAPFKNWGLINLKAKSHIHALDAWKIEEGSRDIIVAVIDTGVDTSHHALAENIWRDSSLPAP